MTFSSRRAFCIVSCLVIRVSSDLDLIVHTILDSSKPPTTETLTEIISRLHVLVIGPGLGRDAAMQGFGKKCLEVAKSLGKWVVLDAE